MAATCRSTFALTSTRAEITASALPPRTARSLPLAIAGVGSAQVRKLRESTKRRKLVRRVNACMVANDSKECGVVCEGVTVAGE